MSDQFLFACDGCREPRQLFARVGERILCPRCWHRAGSPFPAPASAQRVHEAEIATRDRMTARGSTDRHLVRNGRT